MDRVAAVLLPSHAAPIAAAVVLAAALLLLLYQHAYEEGLQLQQRPRGVHSPHLLAAVGAQGAQDGQQLGGAAAAGPAGVLQHVLRDVVHLGHGMGVEGKGNGAKEGMPAQGGGATACECGAGGRGRCALAMRSRQHAHDVTCPIPCHTVQPSPSQLTLPSTTIQPSSGVQWRATSASVYRPSLPARSSRASSSFASWQTRSARVASSVMRRWGRRGGAGLVARGWQRRQRLRAAGGEGAGGSATGGHSAKHLQRS